MAEQTRIAWTDATFNPWIGCTKVSPGCMHCYAALLDERRFSKTMGGTHWGPGAPRHVTTDAYWRQPLAWNRRAAAEGVRVRVFCASLADVFDEEAPAGALDRLWALIRETPNLDWQLLTKRPERIVASLPPDWGPNGYANVWLGTTVEDQQRANERVPILASIPARVRFLSCEPLLGPIDLLEPCGDVLNVCEACHDSGLETDPLASGMKPGAACQACMGLGRIHWVIVGGESGPDHRPMDPAWARSLRDQVQESDAAFFFKQWGGPRPDSRGHLLDGREHHDFPRAVAP